MAKPFEISAIPELIKTLALHGAVVTIDAMGCQKKITQTIIEAQADYVIRVKDNQPGLQTKRLKAAGDHDYLIKILTT